MDIIENMRNLVRKLRDPVFVLYHDPAIPSEAICAAIVEGVNVPATVARLRSDHISAEEGTFISDALLGGRLLLLITSQAKVLPSKLTEAWEYFRENPLGTSSGAGDQIRFHGLDAECELGTLGVILPNNFEGREPRADHCFRVDSLDEFGNGAQPLPDIRILGRAAVSVSMKSLCFLHHRDPEDARHHGSVGQILSGQGKITWRDLQISLQAQPDQNMLSFLEGFASIGRLSAEQLDFAAEAISFLREERPEDIRIGGAELAPSIYHTLWTYGFLEKIGHVFRGQRNSRWRQDATLFRSDPDGAPPTLNTIVRRLHRTQAFLDDFAKQERNIVGRTLTDAERLAIAQHYGLPTPLLDYTRSLAVAAFFATGAGDGSVLQAGDIGVIYYVAPYDPVAAPRAGSRFELDLAQAAGLRFGLLTNIEPVLPDSENRIARQKALFIDGFDSRDLQRFSLGVLYFRQHPGVAFEDERLGITRERLLTPDSKLEWLAENIRPNPPKLSTGLTQARLPSENWFGSLGLELPGNIKKGQSFLDQLAEAADRIEPGLWSALKSILQIHFEEAHIAALTADFSAPEQPATTRRAGITHVLDDVDASLADLARLAGLEPDALIQALRTHRPLSDFDISRIRANELRGFEAATDKARLVVAVGLFIVGIEHLRMVRGNVANQCLEKAKMELSALMNSREELV